jgi:hypothetical protein
MLPNSLPRILCVIPALPSEIKLETLRSIFNQTIPINHTVLLTEKIEEKLLFPAKISRVLNNMFENLKLENYDYILRVDADTVLPLNFVEGNLKQNCEVVGYGPAQLIKVDSFQKCMGGRMHPDHDDGYFFVKYPQCNLSATLKYNVEPVIRRKSGFHQGTSWFLSQGELHFRYGYDLFHECFVVFLKWRNYHPYGIFFLAGYFRALFQRKKRFDVADAILAHNLLKYRHPSRFFRFARTKIRKWRSVK